MCWFTAVILAHRRKEDCCEFEVSVDCIIRFYYKKRKKKEEQEATREGRKRGTNRGRKGGSQEIGTQILTFFPNKDILYMCDMKSLRKSWDHYILESGFDCS